MLKYNVILQRNPRDEDAMPKYHARIISIAQDTISTIAKQLSEDCTPNEEDCLVVVDGIMKQIIAGLKEGKIVKIDRFGSFRLTIKNDGPNCPTVTEYLKDPASFKEVEQLRCPTSFFCLFVFLFHRVGTPSVPCPISGPVPVFLLNPPFL